MVDSDDAEKDLQKLINRLLDKTERDLGEKLLQDEASMFRIVSSLNDKDSSQLVVKLSFCALVLLINEWKREAYEWDLPPFLYNYFKIVDKYIYFTYSPDLKDDIFEVYRGALFEQAREEENILLFVPEKYIQERRLYKIRAQDIKRIADSHAWQKLPDPHLCKSWIKLPAHYERLKKSQVLTRKFTKELLEGVDYSDESVAKKLIIRNQVSGKRNTLNLPDDRPKCSIFKRKVESDKVGGGTRSDSMFTNGILSECDFEISPTMLKIDPYKNSKRTQTSHSTKITNQDSPGLQKLKPEVFSEKDMIEMPCSKSLRDSNKIDVMEGKPQGKIRNYTLTIPHKKLFPN